MALTKSAASTKFLNLNPLASFLPSTTSQPSIWARKGSTSAAVSGGVPPSQGTHFCCARLIIGIVYPGGQPDVTTHHRRRPPIPEARGAGPDPGADGVAALVSTRVQGPELRAVHRPVSPRKPGAGEADQPAGLLRGRRRARL